MVEVIWHRIRCYISSDMGRIGVSLAAAFAALSFFGLPGLALAHAHLESAQPPASGTVAAAPTEIGLTFSEELNQKFTRVKITGPDGKAIKTGDAMLMDGDKTFMVSLPSGLGAGTYQVEWQALSRDGHKTRGTYTFTVKP
jgi:methionine-rich copper-binding protein CopC